MPCLLTQPNAANISQKGIHNKKLNIQPNNFILELPKRLNLELLPDRGWLLRQSKQLLLLKPSSKHASIIKFMAMLPNLINNRSAIN